MVEARSLSDITARAPCVAIVDVVDPREPLPECVVAVLSRTPVALTARAATQARRKRITMAYGDAVADLVGGYVAEVAVGAEGVELTVLGESEDELWDGSLGEEDGRLGGEGGSEGEGRGDESTDKEAAEAAKAEEMRMAIQRDWDMFVEGAGLRAHAGVSGNGAGGNGDAGGHHALGVGAEGREMAGSHPGMNGAGAWGARSPGSGPTEDLSQAPALRALLTVGCRRWTLCDAWEWHVGSPCIYLLHLFVRTTFEDIRVCTFGLCSFLYLSPASVCACSS